MTPQPAKRPRSSYLRFEAEQPNECWQADFTHCPLADGTGTEVLTWLDDHSRLALSVTAHRRVTGPIVLAAFRAAVAAYGAPASTLTDNGMVFTTRFSGGRGGRNALETELRRLGITQKNGKPNHPQTQGKVERFQQTMKKWLAAEQPQPATLTQLQALLDAFTSAYNTRPHRSLPHRATPATAYAARPKATPGDRTSDAHYRVRTDIISTSGAVTLRTGGKLHHIGIGRIHAGTRVLLLVRPAHPHHQRRHRRTAPRTHPGPHPELPAHRRTQGPPGRPQQKPRTLTQVRGHSDVLRDDSGAGVGFEPSTSGL